MNGKQKLVSSAAIGLVIAMSVIVGSNALTISFPSIFGPSSGRAPSLGTLVLTVKDAPPQQRELLKLYVQIGDIILHRAPGEGENSTTTTTNSTTTTLPQTNSTAAQDAAPPEESSESRVVCQPETEPDPFDVIALRNSELEAYLGQCQVPPGRYVMISFDITSASAVFEGTEGDVSLRTPSDSVKVPVHFTIEAGMITGVTLDFQADQFHVTPNDVLRPVVVGLVRYGPSEEETTTTTTTTVPPPTT